MRLILLLFFISLSTFSQTEKKEITIFRIDQAPKIDGNLNESFWLQAKEAKDFVMFRPGTGTPEPENQKTVVKLAYDDEAIYVGAYLYDDNVSSIPMQFTTRDNFGQTDFFLLSINPANDGVNDTEFIVMSTGTQADAKVSDSNGEDFGWSAVWESATKMNQDGWAVEMKIPYSALRFSNNNVQTWGLNIHRRIQSKKEQYSWSFIDKTKGRHTEYNGLIQGISNIASPVRLSFYPYAQGTYTHFDGTNKWQGTAGMDIKYGINDSFTLDATLVPDFSQTSFDDIVVNLGPFEQQYDEKRAFFTEGTELFAKGDLFYSRRIGGTPINYYDVNNQILENEIIVENPIKTRLLNAVKFSGRTNNGLGIGVFNSITLPSKAILKNLITNEERELITNPLTNYNALVFDQQFKNTSSITLVNSNVMRNGSTYDANVTSLLGNIILFQKKYAIGSQSSISKKFGTLDKNPGFEGYLEFNKIHGKNRWGFGSSLSDTKYDKNDFGIQNYNNFVVYYANYSYRIFEPMGNLNSFNLSVNANLNYLFKPYTYTNNHFNVNVRMTDKKELSYGGGINFSIGKKKDFYEPRVSNRFYIYKPLSNFFAWISTDYRKKIAVDITVGYARNFGTEIVTKGPFLEFSPKYRVNNRLQIAYEFSYDKTLNEYGFVDILGEDIVFGRRNHNTFVNSLNGAYNFSTKDVLSLSIRHYWFPLEYQSFYLLQNDGSLTDYLYDQNEDLNYNAWNVDLSYAWEFAPGSQIIAIYRNNIYASNDNPNIKFFKNMDELFENPFTHQFSLKLVYYFDYNKLKM